VGNFLSERAFEPFFAGRIFFSTQELQLAMSSETGI
jgi:hypothetical protein